MNTRPVQTGALGFVTVLSLVLAACASGPAVTTAPTASAPPVSAAPPSSTVAPAIADGLYVGPTLQVTDLIALINADTHLTAAQKSDLIGDAFVIKGHTTFAVSLDLHGGQYAQGQIVDGGAIEIGSRGTYAFSDTHTLVMEESGGLSINTFEVTTTGSGFTLKRTSPPGDAMDVLITAIFWDSRLFTPAP